MAPRRVLVMACELSVRHQLITRYGVPADNVMYPSADMGVASDIANADLLIIDEAHHFRHGNAWHAIIEAAEAANIRWLGFTATPIGETPLFSISYDALRADGWMPERPIGIECTSIEEALDVTRDIPTVTYIAPPACDNYDPRFGRLITADTPPEDRHFRKSGVVSGVASSSDSELRLCAVGTLTTGWDDPDIGAVILARRISEAQTYMQILGRLRRGGIVADLSNNIVRFGLDEDATIAQLAARNLDGGRNVGSGIPILIRCVECERLCSPRVRGHVCPYCGATLPPPAPTTRFWEQISPSPFADPDPKFVDEWRKFLHDIGVHCRAGSRPCPWTPSGAWATFIPRFRSDTVYLSPRTAGHWMRVAQIFRSCVRNPNAVLFASGSYLMYRRLTDGFTLAIDLSYGSSLQWKQVGL